MSNFTGQKIANTYKNLLQVNTSNSDLNTTLITVETGAGNATPLQLATDKVNINGTFQLGGVALTANVTALNNIADLSGITGFVVGDSGTLAGRTLVGTSPISITNANGVAGNPTISLATTGITSATYGPLGKFNIDTYGRVISVSIATTVSANSFIGGVFNGSSLTVENDTSIGGDVVIQGTTNMKAVSATDATLNNLTVGTKITAATVTATTIETSILRATKASITDLTADTLTFNNVSVSTLNANIINVASSTNLPDNVTLNFGDDNDLVIQHNGTHSVIKEQGTGDLFIQSNRIQLTNTGSFSMLTLADGQDAEFPYGVQVSGTVSATSFIGPTITSINGTIDTNINAITSINTVVDNLSATMATSIDNRTQAITSINTVITDLSATMATSIDNRTQAITSINTVIADLSATMATSIDNTNTNVTTNANAITSINTVITSVNNLAVAVSALTQTNLDAITSINTVVDNLSATMATSIDNSNTNITANANAITSINTVVADLSATMATSIDNTNTNVTTNINAITSINTVITDLSATMATSIDNRTAAITSINTVITDVSATMATSINNANGVAVAFAIALG